MTEKKVTETEKAELRDMMAKVTAPIQFKVGDIVRFEDSHAFSGRKKERVGIVVDVQVKPGEGWGRSFGIAVLYKRPDEDGENGVKWVTTPVEAWKCRLV